MKKDTHNANFVKSERGQMMSAFAVVMPLLALFAGFSLDTGVLYLTKAKLSTSVDAACMTGMKNLSLGQTTAAALATNMFNANFGANPPTPSVTFPTDAFGNQQVEVTATAYVNTLFMEYLSQWTSVPVSATAVSTRGKVGHDPGAGPIKFNEFKWRKSGTAIRRSKLHQQLQ